VGTDRVLRAADDRLGGDRVRRGERDPANVHALLPGTEIPPITKALHDSNFGFDRTYSPTEASGIITNNIQVAAGAFAGGMTAGIMTGWIVLTNGLLVGALAALYVKAGFGPDFFATIAPHGVIELSAIQIAGGAGLVLAGGYLRPGRARPPRRATDRRATRRDARHRRRAACCASRAQSKVSSRRSGCRSRCATRSARFTAVALLAYLLGAGAGPESSKEATGLDVDVRVE